MGAGNQLLRDIHTVLEEIAKSLCGDSRQVYDFVSGMSHDSWLDLCAASGVKWSKNIQEGVIVSLKSKT